MEKASKRKFVAPELLSVSAGPDGTSLHAECFDSGSGDTTSCSGFGSGANVCNGPGNSAIFECIGNGVGFFP